MIKKILCLIFLFTFLGVQKTAAQTFLERRIEHLKKEIKIQDDRISEEKITSSMFKRLEKMKIDSSKFNLKDFQDRKQIVLLFETKDSHKRFLTGGIIFNVLGTTLMGLGGNIIYRTRNDKEGFGAAIGALAVTFGTFFNIGSIPFHVASAKKKRKFIEMKKSLIEYKGF